MDLPQPDGPISAVTRRASISRETRSRTWWSPNHAEMSRASRAAAPDPSVWSAEGSVVVVSSSMSSVLAGVVVGVITGVGRARCSVSQQVRQQSGDLVGDERPHQEHRGGKHDPGLGLAPPSPGPHGTGEQDGQTLRARATGPTACSCRRPSAVRPAGAGSSTPARQPTVCPPCRRRPTCTPDGAYGAPAAVPSVSRDVPGAGGRTRAPAERTRTTRNREVPTWVTTVISWPRFRSPIRPNGPP